MYDYRGVSVGSQVELHDLRNAEVRAPLRAGPVGWRGEAGARRGKARTRSVLDGARALRARRGSSTASAARWSGRCARGATRSRCRRAAQPRSASASSSRTCARSTSERPARFFRLRRSHRGTPRRRTHTGWAGANAISRSGGRATLPCALHGVGIGAWGRMTEALERSRAGYSAAEATRNNNTICLRCTGSTVY